MLSISIHALLRGLKQRIKNLKYIEIKVISLDVNIRIISCNGTMNTAANANRIKRKEC